MIKIHIQTKSIDDRYVFCHKVISLKFKFPTDDKKIYLIFSVLTLIIFRFV